MQKILAAVLVVLGLAGLVIGRLGETTWAPETEHSATVELADAGPAVVIDPGVLYVGGYKGTVEITGASDVSVITAAEDDIPAYLGETKHTRITGVPTWDTLSTEVVNPEGPTELKDPTTSDLWRSVETSPSPMTFPIQEFAEPETGDDATTPFRSILIVTDGTQPGAESVTITWPVDAQNAWVPYAYAGGAALAVIGLIWFVLVFRGGRRDAPHEDDHLEESPAESAAPGPELEPTPVTGRQTSLAAGGGAVLASTSESREDAVGTHDEDDLTGEPTVDLTGAPSVDPTAGPSSDSGQDSPGADGAEEGSGDSASPSALSRGEVGGAFSQEYAESEDAAAPERPADSLPTSADPDPVSSPADPDPLVTSADPESTDLLPAVDDEQDASSHHGRHRGDPREERS